MRLVEMKCPSCGAQLRVDAEKDRCYCIYCGMMIFLDDEKKHVVVENPEELGYRIGLGMKAAEREEQERKRRIAEQQAQIARERQFFEEQKRIDASRRGTLCPKCGNYHTQYTVKESTALGLLYFELFCPNCGYCWRIKDEYYTLKIIGSVFLWLSGFGFMLPLYFVKKLNVSVGTKVFLFCLLFILEIVLMALFAQVL